MADDNMCDSMAAVEQLDSLAVCAMLVTDEC